MLAEKYYRPLVHFTPPFGWLNDPNGLVYKDGEYHLFYQYHPTDSVWGPMHWGHAVSRDLLSWTHLPIALAPDALGVCFSGTAMVDKGDKSGLFDGKDGLLAYYTITADKTLFNQSQGLAYSNDNGRHWRKYAGNPVIANPGFDDFRDPKVFWHEQTQAWIMLTTVGQQIAIYRSVDAKTWLFSSFFGEEHGAHDERAWECPDLFEISVEGSKQTRWVLIVGVQRGAYSGGSGTQYFVGQFDGEQFINENTPETVLWLDYGRDFYATQTWSDIPAADGRRIGISWMSNWLYANQVPTQSWRSAMTIPQELTLKDTPDGLRLCHAFIRELEALCQHQETAAEKTQVTPGAVFSFDWSEAHRLQFSLALKDNSSLVLQPMNELELSIKVQKGQLTLRCQRHGQIGVAEFDEHFPHDFSVELGANRPLSVDLLLDRCSAELLLDGGLYAITNLVFPNKGPAQQCVASLRAGEVVIRDFHRHDLAKVTA
ncbi:glycoside hydrolase family 32 protein [uncultured Tolumonas sp.]|uniref:glycoside hydrolase family 32 protein n=1 Tax=uncultured Tolumonas sp. TaxID=263765 RepID=UPI0029313C4E|nr:glycoside hydrolase family 32 protein [uncultured Tolumonas sp.]